MVGQDEETRQSKAREQGRQDAKINLGDLANLCFITEPYEWMAMK
jgi:hypothetical protein